MSLVQRKLSFDGIWSALVTPFLGPSFHKGIDYQALDGLCARQISAGVSGLVIAGSTGENATLSLEDQKKLLDHVADQIKGSPLKLMFGITTSSTEQALSIAQWAQEKAHALLIMTPSLNRPTFQGCKEHFKQICSHVKIPVVLYHNPSRTGLSLKAAQILEIVQSCPSIQSIKESSGNILITQELADSIPVLCGDDALFFASLCCGASGGILVSSQIAPALFQKVIRDIDHQEINRAKKLFQQALPWIQMLFDEPNPVGLKYLLSSLGWIQNELRLPLLPATGEFEHKIQNALPFWKTFLDA